mmetsp:Transcript_49906/g.150082  ORF Transcript_49906/g.150082 Transcript_49906/m.150082 type:complete len:295 (-) Transcript_49906:37-921(-)
MRGMDGARLPADRVLPFDVLARRGRSGRPDPSSAPMLPSLITRSILTPTLAPIPPLNLEGGRLGTEDMLLKAMPGSEPASNPCRPPSAYSGRCVTPGVDPNEWNRWLSTPAAAERDFPPTFSDPPPPPAEEFKTPKLDVDDDWGRWTGHSSSSLPLVGSAPLFEFPSSAVTAATGSDLFPLPKERWTRSADDRDALFSSMAGGGSVRGSTEAPPPPEGDDPAPANAAPVCSQWRMVHVISWASPNSGFWAYCERLTRHRMDRSSAARLVEELIILTDVRSSTGARKRMSCFHRL